MTTTLLLLASLRDALGEEGGACREEVQGMLFLGEQGEVGRELEEGEEVATSRLLPSFQDRKSYFQAVLGAGAVGEDSHQARAKALFDRRIAAETAGLGRAARARWVEGAVAAVLDRMGVTLVTILTEVNLAQVFLWLQEKSLFGEASPYRF